MGNDKSASRMEKQKRARVYDETGRQKSNNPQNLREKHRETVHDEERQEKQQTNERANKTREGEQGTCRSHMK